jgi:hypothetical protein
LAKALTIDPAVIRRLQELPKPEKAECLAALCELPGGFGQPHRHDGLAIRKLGDRLFECRGSLRLRFFFQDRPDNFYVSFLGDHDEIKALLKSGRYR